MAWHISATIYYWPGSFEDKDVKEFKIQKLSNGSRDQAGEELDLLIEKKKKELDNQGFRTRHDHWAVVDFF